MEVIAFAVQRKYGSEASELLTSIHGIGNLEKLRSIQKCLWEDKSLGALRASIGE